MDTYAYTAIDRDGKIKAGLVEAADEAQVASILREQKMIITSLEVKRNFAFTKALKKYRRIPETDKVVFTRQLSTMIAAGLTLSKCLEILEKQTTNTYLKEVIGEMMRDVDGGLSFSKALAKHESVFPRIFGSLVKAGEASGSLDKILDRLAIMMEQEHEFRAKTKGAMIYPVIVMIAMVGVMGVMFVFVIPKLMEMYSQMDLELPLPTRILMDSSSWAQRNVVYVLLVAVAIGFVLRKFSQTVRGKYYFADTALNLPIFGKLNKQTQFGSLARTLSMLLGSGVPILEALDIIRDTLGNIRMREGIAKVAADVEKGDSLGDALAKNPVFPTLLTQMAKVGERTGRLDDVLVNVSDYFEKEAMHTTESLSAAIEPIIIIILAVGAGFLIISIILPIYSLVGSF